MCTQKPYKSILQNDGPFQWEASIVYKLFAFHAPNFCFKFCYSTKIADKSIDLLLFFQTDSTEFGSHSNHSIRALEFE